MVCQGYKAPDVIDPKFLDPKFALADCDDEDKEEETAQKITSLKKLLNPSKRNRGGYADGKALIYDECDLIDFLESQDPYEYLTKFNKFNYD